MIYAVNITKKNISKALEFCLPYEEFSVNLVNFLIQEEKRSFSSTDIKEAKLFFLDEKIIGVALVNTHNFFLYCFDFYGSYNNKEGYNKELLKTIASMFDFNLIYAIMGEANFQKQLLNYLSKTLNIEKKVMVHYILMAKLKTQEKVTLPPLACKLKIAKASVKDVNILLDLQVGYDKEEVCERKKEFPRYISLINLERILKDEITYFAKIGELSVTKANTNAIGVNYAQIGGVYTLVSYRGYGIASHVVNDLIEHISIKEGKNTCLFVKKANTKAIGMYKRLGLKEKGEFCISYFR